MDSIEWSKKYEVVSISRLHLQSLGFSSEQLTSLSDKDMQALADGLQESISKTIGNLLEEVRFMVRLYLAEKEMQHGGEKRHAPDYESPQRQDVQTSEGEDA